jgi:hypothetical protein
MIARRLNAKIAGTVHFGQFDAMQNDHSRGQSTLSAYPALNLRRIQRIQCSSCGAIGNLLAPVSEIESRVEAESRVGRHANLVVRDLSEDYRASRSALTVNHHHLAGASQAFIFIEIGTDLSAAVIGNSLGRFARRCARKQDYNGEQRREKFHIPILLFAAKPCLTS